MTCNQPDEIVPQPAEIGGRCWDTANGRMDRRWRCALKLGAYIFLLAPSLFWLFLLCGSVFSSFGPAVHPLGQRLLVTTVTFGAMFVTWWLLRRRWVRWLAVPVWLLIVVALLRCWCDRDWTVEDFERNHGIKYEEFKQWQVRAEKEAEQWRERAREDPSIREPHPPGPKHPLSSPIEMRP